MESTVVVEENHESGSANLVTGSVGSFIKIDSIFIDLVNASNGSGEEKCDHFSIRGYVSEVRSKDRKKCWPFAIKSIHGNSEHSFELPSLDVPKFKWWSCQNCLREVGSIDISREERALVSRSKHKSIGPCRHSEASLLLSDSQQAEKLNSHGSKFCSPNPSLNTNRNGIHRSLCGDKGKTTAEIASPSILGSGNSVAEISNVLNCAVVKDIPSHMQQICQTNLAFRSKRNGYLENNSPDLRDHEGVDVTDINNGCMVKNNSEMLNKVPAPVRNKSRHPCLDFDDCDNLSSESAEVLPGTASGSSHRRKTRKVRLLTELLGKHGDERTSVVRAESSPTDATPDASAEENSFSVPQGVVTVQGHVSGSLGQNRKRKLPEDEDWRAMEMTSPNSVCKKIRGFNKGTGNSATGSDLEGMLTGAVSDTGAKSHLINFKVDEHSLTAKKKNKRTQVTDDCLFLTPPQDNLQVEPLKKSGDASKSNAANCVLFNFETPASIGRGVDPFHPASEKTQKKSSLSKRKNLMTQGCDVHGFPFPGNNSMHRERFISNQDAAFAQIGSSSAQGALTEKGLPLSFMNCISTEIVDGKYISSTMGATASLLPWQGETFKGDGIIRRDIKMNHVSDSSFSSKSELDARLLQGAPVGLNSRRTSHTTSFPDEKLKESAYQTENGSVSLLQQMHYCAPRHYAKNGENQENILTTEKGSNRRAEKVPDQDDIPMEIVELLAKNQYERCLPDSKTEKQPSIATKDARNNKGLDLNKACGSGEVYLFTGDSADETNSRVKNGRIGQSTKSNSMSQLDQSCAPTGFRQFARCGEKAFQFPDASSSRHDSAQNCSWAGSVVGNRSSHTTMQALVPCNSCQSAPQQKAAHIWPSMMPNNLTFSGNIPPRCSHESANTDTHSRCPSSLPRGMNGGDDRNFLNPSTSNLDIHNRKFDSETLRRIPSNYPFSCKHNGAASLDLHSNDTIPAMHLLSLMDAGFQSGAPIDFNGSQKFHKTASIPHNHRTAEYLGIAPAGYRTSNAMNYPASDSYGKKQRLADFHGQLAAIPPAGASTSFQHDRFLKKDSAFPVQSSLKSQEKDKIQKRNQRSQKTVPSRGGLSTTCEANPAHSMPKLMFGTANVLFPPQFHAVDNATKYKLGTQAVAGNGGLLFPSGSSTPGICSINRNPADFSVPEEGNEYMIRGEDLKFGWAPPAGSRSGLLKMGGHKRQKKLPVVKDRLWSQTS